MWFDSDTYVDPAHIEAFQIQKDVKAELWQGVFFMTSGKMVYTEYYTSANELTARYEQFKRKEIFCPQKIGSDDAPGG